MAFLAHLCQLKQDIAACKQRPYGKSGKVKAADDEIFPEGPALHIGPTGTECVDPVCRKQADLTVPMAGMGISPDSPVSDQFCRLYGLFLRSPYCTNTYGFYASHLILQSDSSFYVL